MKSLFLAFLLLILGSCFVPSYLFGPTSPSKTPTNKPESKVEDIVPKSSEEGLALIYFGFAVILISGGVYILVKSGVRLPFVRQE